MQQSSNVPFTTERRKLQVVSVSVRLVAVVAMAAVAAACGGDGSSPTGPSASATSIMATLDRNPLFIGQTGQATANVSLSTGQTQAVTSGWRSDVPAVATVSDTGTVMGVANGLANIYVVSNGRQGTINLRVAPNYQGQWRGSYIVQGCTESGGFVGQICSNFAVGRVLPTSMTLTQTGLAISGQFQLGQIGFGSFSAPIEGDGSAAFSAGDTQASSISINTSWRINALADGRLTGAHTQVWRASGLAGEARVTAIIVDWLNRVSGLAPSSLTPVLPMNTIRSAVEGVTKPN